MLTHGQAGLLRAMLSVKGEFGAGDFHLDDSLCKLLPPEILHYDSYCEFLNYKAREQLAEYDAKYMVVERAEHRRLTSLENKIDDFLDWSMLGDNQLEVGEEGGLRVVEQSAAGRWEVETSCHDAQPKVFEHCGSAMREALRVWCEKWDAAHEGEDDDQT